MMALISSPDSADQVVIAERCCVSSRLCMFSLGERIVWNAVSVLRCDIQDLLLVIVGGRYVMIVAIVYGCISAA